MTAEPTAAKLAEDDEPNWRQFERAVAEFLAAAGPTAKVSHDYRQTDPDTGSLRQRDVWIESVLCGMFPIKALVSCKRWSAKLNAKDIEHFFGELCGANAHLGILYSHSGFADTAVPKAKALGRDRIHCCQLFTDQPPEIPESLLLPQCYCATSTAAIELAEPPDPKLNLKTWGDVFALGTTITEEIKAAFDKMLEQAKSIRAESPGFPDSYACELSFADSEAENQCVKIRVKLGWKFYEGDFKANLLNGTYCLTEDRFVGSQASPVIDTQGPHPGPAWKLLDSQPQFPKPGLVCILTVGIKDDALQRFATKPVIAGSSPG